MRRENIKTLFAVYVDLMSVLNSMERAAPLEDSESLGVPTKLIEMLALLDTITISCVRVNE